MSFLSLASLTFLFENVQTGWQDRKWLWEPMLSLASVSQLTTQYIWIDCQQALGDRDTGPQRKATDKLHIGHHGSVTSEHRGGRGSSCTSCSLKVHQCPSVRANSGIQVKIQSQELIVFYWKFSSFCGRKSTFISCRWALDDGAVFCLPGSSSR